MSTEGNKAIVVRHLKDVLEQGCVELIDSYYAPQGTDSSLEPLEAWKNRVLWFHKTCPGFEVTILNIMAEGDEVMTNVRFDLTYTVPDDPPPMNFPPLGKPVSWRNMNVFRVLEGKLVDHQIVMGWTDMLVETGVNPSEKLEKNKAVARRVHEEAWNQGKIDLMEEYIALDGSESDMKSLDTVKANITFFHKIAPGFKFTILDLLAEGDTVMTHWQVDITYSVPADPPMDEFFPPLGKPVSWKGVDTYRIVDGKIVSVQYANPYYDTMVKIGVIPLEKITKNKASVNKFIDAVNRRDNALLEEVCTPEVAKDWVETLPGAYANFKDHHIELVDMVADGEMVAVKMATSGYHTGEVHNLPATGKWWTNHGNCLFYFSEGKISKTDFVFDIENHIQQLGGVIRPVAV